MKYNQIVEKYFSFFANWPVAATSVGLHQWDGEMPEISAAARDKEVVFCTELLDAIASCEPGDADEAADLLMLRNELERVKFRIEVLRSHEWDCVEEYAELCGNAVYSLIARPFAPIAQRLRSVVGRLGQFDRVLRQIRATVVVERVPEIFATTYAKQNGGVVELLESAVLPELESVDDDAELCAAVRAAVAQCKVVVAEHQKWIDEQLVPAAKGDFRLGRDVYLAKMKFALAGDPRSVDELQQQARDLLERTTERMYDLARYLLPVALDGYEQPEETADVDERRKLIKQALSWIYQKKPSRESLMDDIRRDVRAIEQVVAEAGDFLSAKTKCEVIEMPKFRAGVAGAYCDASPPLEEPALATFYAAAPIPEEWSDQMVNSFLSEYNTASLFELSLHEAVPGHFLQLEKANELRSKLRKALGDGAFIEGWAVYCESVCMSELYYYSMARLLIAGEPTAKAKMAKKTRDVVSDNLVSELVNCKWLLRVTINAILDFETHCNPAFEKADAMRLMMEDGFQEEAEAVKKWDRAQLTSCQLSTYCMGYLQHTAMREEIARRWGDQFTLRRYHDAVLAHGSAPVPVVQKLILKEEIKL